MGAIATGALSKNVVVAKLVRVPLHISINLGHVWPSHSSKHHDAGQIKLSKLLDERSKRLLDDWVDIGLANFTRGWYRWGGRSRKGGGGASCGLSSS